MMNGSQTTPRPGRPTISSRKRKHDFAAARIPRYWQAGNALATHIADGVNMLFPEGERFFVRSVRHYLDRIQKEDPELASEVKGFFGQEGNHAREHERFFAHMRDQGYEIDEFLEEFTRTLRYLENLSPPALRLASTAAAEHFTAIMARGALGEGALLDSAHPAMRDFLRWHAAEEIEHKSVAFDVLQRVAPSYALRVAGLAMATGFLLYWWQRGTRLLMAQDGMSREDAKAAMAELRKIEGGDRAILRDVFLKGALEYLKPGFHPWDHDDAHLAEQVMAELEAA